MNTKNGGESEIQRYLNFPLERENTNKISLHGKLKEKEKTK